jgi:uncharacterized C2H2 Zn-finger protein
MAGLECYPCDEEGAGETHSASPASLIPFTMRAKRDTHSTFKCPRCSYNAKNASHLMRHLADKHDIGVTWHARGQPGCDFKAKRAASLTRHLADKHDIGVTWHARGQPGCDFKGKRAYNLTMHLQARQFAVYCQRKKEQEERVRVALLASGWLEWSSSDTLPPPGQFKREHRIDFECAEASADQKNCRIDFVLAYEDGW